MAGLDAGHGLFPLFPLLRTLLVYSFRKPTGVLHQAACRPCARNSANRFASLALAALKCFSLT
jgi:hypothetical protein